ncbi:TetR/AcrR family transcriptional regulator [Tsuneonella amylolytica]|uniref:TetR/AcrR family transcriptional regulator n=1 Tax=Tsuneonella amylolytica TaxID=2338327 RepID=UPI0013C406BA|nr:TetR/AcrR family transcriptional regulator [Tsuneonella amylolytica]
MIAGMRRANGVKDWMPKRSREYMDSQRLRFCEAAMACFSRNGVVATNLTDICDETGLSMGALYKHFASRDELLVAVLQLRLEHRNALLRGETWAELRDALLRYRNDLDGLPFWRELQAMADWNERLAGIRVEQAGLILAQIKEQLARYVATGEISPAFDLSRTTQLVSIIFEGSLTSVRSSGDLHIVLEDLADYLDLAVGVISD